MDEKSVKSRIIATKGYEKIVKQLFDALDFVSVDTTQDKMLVADDREHVFMHITNIGKSFNRLKFNYQENMHFLNSEMRGKN